MLQIYVGIVNQIIKKTKNKHVFLKGDVVVHSEKCSESFQSFIIITSKQVLQTFKL